MSARIRKAYVDTPAGQLHYRHAPGGGTPILFFHRTPVSSQCFEALFGRLGDAHALYAFDTPGFGESFVPPGDPSTTDYRDAFLAAIDALRIGRYHLFAHHTGTHFATEIAAARPGQARSLMVNGVMYATAEERAAFRRAIADPEPIDFEGEYLARTWKLVRTLFPSFVPQLVHTELVGALRSMEGRRQAFGAIFAQDYPAVLRRVQCPVLAMCAGDDPLRPFLDRLRAELPQVETLVLGSAVIAAPELDTDGVARAIEAFVAKVEGWRPA